MKTAVISYIDDNLKENFEEDFLQTLRKDAKYIGEVFLIYYGKDKNFANRIAKKFNVNVFFSEAKLMMHNQRNKDICRIINLLSSEISVVMCIDGGDVWFQAPIDDVFLRVKNSYGFVEEVSFADETFNLYSINRIENKKMRSSFFKEAQGKKLINSGMIVGRKEKIKKILNRVSHLTFKTNQDYFGLDQAVLNYVIREDGHGLVLPERYNYHLYFKKNSFFVKEKLFYDENSYLINIVHNLGNMERLLPRGRKSLCPVLKLPEKLPGSFWGVTSFFNSAGYKNKIKNYKIFRKKSQKQGLKLLTVELAFGDKEFELKKSDADILIQLRTNSIMWHKERLINIGIENLPEDCDKFVWLDADIIFLNKNWIKETCENLQQYAIVQPFCDYLRLSEGKSKVTNPPKVVFPKEMDLENHINYGVGYNVSQLGIDILKRPVEIHGQVGLAWAARRNIFKNEGILDCSAFPNLDLFIAHLFYNNDFNKQCKDFSNQYMRDCFLQWSEKIYPKIKGSVYFTNGTVMHLWHGSMTDRKFEECVRIINKYGFDPKTDIKISENGCYAWASQKLDMQEDIKNYFFDRNEGGIINFEFLLDRPLYFINKTKKEIVSTASKTIDKNLGRVGIVIKKISPKTYHWMKNIERKIRRV